MVSGAARAEAALLVIDAHEGIVKIRNVMVILVSMLGIRQIVVLVNKMDLIDFDNETYNSLVEEYPIS
jgi:bifunctional enzyme CysN/CysC